MIVCADTFFMVFPMETICPGKNNLSRNGVWTNYLSTDKEFVRSLYKKPVFSLCETLVCSRLVTLPLAQLVEWLFQVSIFMV